MARLRRPLPWRLLALLLLLTLLALGFALWINHGGGSPGDQPEFTRATGLLTTLPLAAGRGGDGKEGAG